MYEKICEFNGHSAAIYSIDADENKIYTSSGDTFIARWLLENGTQDKFSIKAESAVYKLKLLADKSILAFGTNSGSLHIVDLLQKKEIKHFTRHASAIFSIAENPYKQHVYVADGDGNLSVWDIKNWTLLLFLPLSCGKIRDILVDEKGEHIFLACQNGTIKIFDTKNFNERESFDAHIGGTNCLQFHPQKNNLLFSGGKDGHVKIWNYIEKKELIALPAHNFAIYTIIFMNDGKNFITGSRDKTIKIWDTKTLSVIQKIERKNGGHSYAVNDLVKLNEKQFASCGDDKKVIVFGENQ